MRSVSILTTHRLTFPVFDNFMHRLTAVRDDEGWELERNGHTVWIRLGSEDIPSMFSPEELERAANLVGGGKIQSRVSLIYVEEPQNFGERMATAISRAMAEQWPSVWDNHFGDMFAVKRPGAIGNQAHPS